MQVVRASFASKQLAFCERTVPNLAQHQIFLTDPNGTVVELNFPGGLARSPKVLT